MTLTELRYLVAVAEELHFGRAAERCFVSQPSLSASIRKVEDELGVAVFDRDKRGVRLTEVGAEVVAQARRALEEAERVRQVAKQGRNQLRGVLRFGVIHTIAPYLLPALVETLRRVAPEMPLDIEENTTANLDRLLKSGEIDVAVLALPYEAPGIEVQPLYDEVFALVAPLRHPLAKKREITTSDLDRADLLLLPVGHCLRDQVLETCAEFSRAPPAGRMGNSLETLRSMVASGLGVTVLPATALVDRYATPLAKVVPFAAPQPMRRVVLAWRRGFARPNAVRRIGEAIRSLPLPVTPLALRTGPVRDDLQAS